MGIIKSDDWAFDSDKWFVMSTFLGTHKTFTQLLTAARNEYQSLSSGSTAIYSPRGRDDAGWYRSNTRPSRPWESVILPDGVKEWLLADMEEFLREKRFYQMRGLPWRRGYLFYGVPGSGKSSLIAALAHKLQLSIYLINLGAKGLDDDKLQGLLQACPGNCILLMEDIDCAFKKRKSKSRSEKRSSSSSSSSSSSESCSSSSDSDSDSSSNITLSGLLNALDGVASSEGRLLFCTTNWVDKIDEALSRPGRCDVWIQFSNATKEQIKNLFLQFFRPASSTPTTPSSSDTSTPEEKGLISDKVDHTLSFTYPDTLKTEVNDDIDIASLADQFSEAIPEGKVSISALQGYLMRSKREPVKALEGVKAWIESGCGKGPTMTLPKKGVEMRDVEKGDSEDEPELNKSKGKKGRKDKKDKKDKKEKKKKGDKKEVDGLDKADSEGKKHDSDSQDAKEKDDAKGKDINSDTNEVANGDGTAEGDDGIRDQADAAEDETHIEEIGNE
uniref:AAA+ ATPase domain-containing protein n=1 Tax=Kwoniella bestiolae CBS 10118 TaxID=1296100 RepID=A0A1B9FYZ0_9TREE|nr:hypothetical protein I302_06979 [Kwoniella bestiolae CBS 10118]OCF23993.1 hypothetical protein I302_06979 [Kwoniella bestiolae CBS 10118]